MLSKCLCIRHCFIRSGWKIWSKGGSFGLIPCEGLRLFPAYCNMEMHLIPVTLALPPSSPSCWSPGLCLASGTAHERTEENPYAIAITNATLQSTGRKQSCGRRWRVCFPYSELMERSFLVRSNWLSSWLIDWLMLLAFFSSVGGVLGGWEPRTRIF